MIVNDITGMIVDSAIEVHRTLGPGLLEEVYKQCLKSELASRGAKVLTEVGMPVHYKGQVLEVGFRIDMLVEDKVVVELKSVHQLHPIHQAQLYTYLKLSAKPVGLVINFNSKLLRDGIIRVKM